MRKVTTRILHFTTSLVIYKQKLSMVRQYFNDQQNILQPPATRERESSRLSYEANISFFPFSLSLSVTRMQYRQGACLQCDQKKIAKCL